MSALKYYAKSLKGYWPTAKALSSNSISAYILLVILLSIPLRKRLFGLYPKKLQLRINGRSIPVFVRDGTDISALREIFADKDYAFTVLTGLSPTHIADIGSHIGISVLYFNAQYPNAKITAYEPDPQNFKLLQKNAAAIPNVVCVNAAVTDKTGFISFYPNTASSNQASITPVQGSGTPIQVACIALDEVIAQGVDFIKFDVEGAEVRMFEPARLKVNAYVGEVHHDAIQKSREEFERLFPGYRFAWKTISKGYSLVAISKS